MIIAVLHELYNSKGMSQISIAGDYLTIDAPYFGAAIEEIYITLHFKHGKPPKGKGFTQMYESFHDRLATLPECTFFRKKRTVELDFEAKFATGFDIGRSNSTSVSIRPDWIKSAVTEIAENISTVKAKLKSGDDFDFSAFNKYILEKLEQIPADENELRLIEQSAIALKEDTKTQEGGWAKIDITWSDYHVNAKTFMPHPYQWSSDDEFSPNGNDVGADVLSMFNEWNKKTELNPKLFLRKILSHWEVRINSPYESEYTSDIYFKSVVALVFACCKYRGFCDSDLKDMAMVEIDKRITLVRNGAKWEHMEECLWSALDSSETVLSESRRFS